MIFMFRQIRRSFPDWERPVQIGFVTALLLLLAAGVMVVVAPQEQRANFLVAFGALALVAEGIVLWGNRGMLAPITQAQRAYLKGDFEKVLTLLEPLREAAKADVRCLMLLGSTYRQLGRLDDSLAVLSEALDKSPNHHYSLYGFGRTLVVKGDYAQGVTSIENALAAGAPDVVRFDLAEAYYRLGDRSAAANALSAASAGEPYRQMMAAYWKYQMGMGLPPSSELIAAGLPFWRAQAERFANTPYGAAVALEVTALEQLKHGESFDERNTSAQ